jgi:hypothetical protein
MPTRKVLGRDHSRSSRPQNPPDFADEHVGVYEMLDHLVRHDNVGLTISVREPTAKIRAYDLDSTALGGFCARSHNLHPVRPY